MTEQDTEQRERKEHLAHLGGLLAGFAHEIRNPLSTIGLNLELVKEDFEGSAEPRDRRTFKRLNVVQGEVKRLQAIVEEFLGFVRSPRPKRRRVDVHAMLTGLVELNEPEMREAGVTLQFLGGGGVGEVELDPDQISAVVVNLLRNAKEACQGGGEVLLSLRRRDDVMELQVTDSGEGMAPEVSARAFEPYFSTKKSGTGLGLPMARRIAEEHGGTLTLSSDPGKGTQFTLRLPMSGKTGAGGAS